MTNTTTTTITDFAGLYRKAQQAGQQAADAITPQPMVVGTATSLFGNDIDRTKPVYVVRGGVCGFAWVVIKPATGGFVRWLKAQNIGYKNYYGGWAVSANPRTAPDLAQSMEIKRAYAYAFAQVLKEAGLKAYVESRMD